MKNGLLIGRWQTLHEGHDWLVEQVKQRGLHPVMAIRDTKITDKDPHTVGERIIAINNRYGAKVSAIVIPDIAAVFYGRDVGYDVVGLVPPNDIAEISGTKIRNDRMADGK